MTQHSSTSSRKSSGLFINLSISTAEKKILLFLLYYMIFIIIVTIYAGLRLATSEELAAAMEANFLCEATGSNNECTRSAIEQYSYPVLTGIAQIMMGFVPAMSVIFVIQWNETRNVISNWFRKTKGRDTTHTSIKGMLMSTFKSA